MSRKIDLWADDRPEPLSQEARLLLRVLNRYDRDTGNPDDPSWIAEISIWKLARHAGITVERATEAAKELAARDPQGVGIDGEAIVLRG
jgi:hypothetical protein